MDADLMRAPGDEIQLEERPAIEPLAYPIARRRLAAVRHDRHPLPVLRVAADGRLDPPDGGVHRALDECQVGLLDATCLELRHQRLLRRVVLGDDEQPGRVAIQPMDDARARDAGDRAVRPGSRQQPVDQRAAPVSRRRVDDEPRGLVDDEDVGVLVRGDDLDRRVGLEVVGRHGFGDVEDHHGFARHDAIRAKPPSLAVDQPPIGDQALHERPRQARPVGDEPVDPADDLARRDREAPLTGLHGDRRRLEWQELLVVGLAGVDLGRLRERLVEGRRIVSHGCRSPRASGTRRAG